MNIYQKFAIIFISFSLLIWLLLSPLTDIDINRKYIEMPEDNHKLTQVELNDFLGVWSNFMQSTFKDSLKSTSLASKESYPSSFKNWLDLQHWSVERFFYTEQKVRDLLKYAEIKSRLEENMKIVKSSNINLHSMNKDLQSKLERCPYDSTEIELIINNIYQITEVLSGRAILGNPR